MGVLELARSLQQRDNIKVEDWAHFCAVYVDPSLHDLQPVGASAQKHRLPISRATSFSTFVDPHKSTLIVGPRGTGKSTLKAGLEAYSKLNTKDDRWLVCTLDAKTIASRLRMLASAGADQLSGPIVTEIVFDALADALFDALEALRHSTRAAILQTLVKTMPDEWPGEDISVASVRRHWQSAHKRIADPAQPLERHTSSTGDQSVRRSSGPFVRDSVQDHKRREDHSRAISHSIPDHKGSLDRFLSALHQQDNKFAAVFIFVEDFSEVPVELRDAVWTTLYTDFICASYRPREVSVSFKIATYRGAAFGPNRSVDPKYMNIVSTDHFDRYSGEIQDLEFMDGKWTEFYRKIIDARVKLLGGSWETDFAQKLPPTVHGIDFSPGTEIDEVKNLYARMLYYASSGQIRYMGHIIEQASAGGPISAAAIREAAGAFYETFLAKNLDAYCSFISNTADHRVFVKDLSLLWSSILDSIEGGRLASAPFFKSSFIVRRDATEELIRPLANAGYLLKRADVGGFSDGSQRKPRHEFAVYSLHYGAVHLDGDIDARWDVGHVIDSERQTRQQFLSACVTCDRQIAELAGLRSSSNDPSASHQGLYKLFLDKGWLPSAVS